MEGHSEEEIREKYSKEGMPRAVPPSAKQAWPLIVFLVSSVSYISDARTLKGKLGSSLA